MADALVIALNRLVDGHDLDTATAREVMDRIMDGAAGPAQIGALLAALRLKGESIEEICGFVESMRDHAVPVHLNRPAVDTCGTGGDSLGTFNISTAAALVAAGAGCTVAKHGNRAASSRCGSADVLEALGVVIALSPEGVLRCIDAAGIGFLFAPAFHPAMRHAAAARGELGIRTVFNVIGPLANPARVRHQLLGVPVSGLAEKMAHVLQRLGHHRALVFAGPDGIDELALHAPVRGFLVGHGDVEELIVDPGRLGLAPAPLSAFAGGDAAANAAQILAVLGGAVGPARDVVLLNAAAAIFAAERVPSIEAGLEEAATAIDSGAAGRRLELLIMASQAEAA
jgi:anthranilate phosphoribosyltransferase